MEESNEKLVSLSYQPSRRLLAAARPKSLAVWKHMGAAPPDAPRRRAAAAVGRAGRAAR